MKTNPNEIAHLKRQLEVERSLDRIRDLTMKMKGSAELASVIKVVFHEAIKLGFGALSCDLVILNKVTGGSEFWISGTKDDENIGEPIHFRVPKINHRHYMEGLEAWRKRRKIRYTEIKGRSLKSYLQKLFEAMEDSNWPESVKEYVLALSSVHHTEAYMKYGFFRVAGERQLDREEENILKRFAKVFEQTFTRFLDLQKAEAQTREAQIEAALERVRSASMAMHKSEEIALVAGTLFKQFAHLGVYDLRRCVIWTLNPQQTSFQCWYTTEEGESFANSFSIPLKGNATVEKYYKIWKRKKPESFKLKGKSYSDWGKFIHHHGWKYPQGEKPASLMILNEFPFEHGLIEVATYSDLNKNDYNVAVRFTKVFEQAYTRFIDLQKAETQAREAQIEAALERVRGRSMAMQRSDELTDVAAMLFKELRKLGGNLWACGFGLCDIEKDYAEHWMSVETGLLPMIKVPIDLDHIQHEMYDSWRENKKPYSVVLEGDELKQLYEKMASIGPLNQAIEKAKETTITIPAFQKNHVIPIKHGYLLVATLDHYSEENIFIRFAKVFEQTYTRFLDLQKAETQAREAKIEAALERVRTASMAMHASEDIAQVAATLFRQFAVLGVHDLRRCVIWTLSPDHTRIKCWYTTEEGESVANSFSIPIKGNKTVEKLYQVWKSKRPDSFPLKGKSYSDWGKFIRRHGWKYPKGEKPAGLMILNEFPLEHGLIEVVTYSELGEVDLDLATRFTKAFEQSYTRFLDLQKAEAQAREAQIEAAMEKVRARAMAMQSPDELKEVAELLRKEMGSLGIEELETSSIYLVGENSTECWYAIKDVRKKSTRLVSDHMTIDLHDTWVGSEMQKFYRSGQNQASIVMKGAKRKEWINYCASRSSVLKGYYGDDIPERTYHLLKFTGGYMGAASPGDISGESWDLLHRCTRVFALAYTRFKDLQQAAARAREVQIELALERVRARTMAMQHSDELRDAAFLLAQQVRNLDIQAWGCAFHIYANDEGGDYEWFSTEDGYLPFYKTPRKKFFKTFYEKRQSGETLFVKEFKGKECERHYTYILSLPVVGDALRVMQKKGVPLPESQIDHVAYFKYGYVLFITYDPVPEAHPIFRRFAIEFEQTYTRFLDLKKAEEQAREAKIEAALERVRAASMAMHNSSEIQQVVNVLREQMGLLDQSGLQTCVIHIYEGRAETFESWYAFKNTKNKLISGTTRVPVKGSKLVTRWLKGYLSAETEYSIVSRGQELKDWQLIRNNLEPDMRRGFGTPPIVQYYHFADFNGGSLLMVSADEASSDSKDLQKRAANVFGLAYRRFLDLKKAEEQAREAQIEAALERIRARTMAMQKTDELLKVGALLYREISNLGVSSVTSGYTLIDEDGKVDWNYVVNPDDGTISEKPLGAPRDETKVMRSQTASWEKQEPYHLIELNPRETIKHQTYIAENLINFQFTAEELISYTPERLALQTFNFEQGYLLIVGAEKQSEENVNMIIRFAKVFEQTYTRFLDLQKAEAQAREAQIEAALERVRARTMAMHTSDELPEVIGVVFEQLRHIGLEMEAAAIDVYPENSRDLCMWVAIEHQSYGFSIDIPYIDNPLLKDYVKAKRYQTREVTHSYSKAVKDKFYQYAFEKTSMRLIPDDRKKMIFDSPGVDICYSCMDQISLFLINYKGIRYKPEVVKVIRRFAEVFQQTYTRFLDLQKAEAQAREAQIEAALERVRARAMAMHHSDELGEASVLLYKELRSLGLKQFFICGYVEIDIENQIQYGWTSTFDGDQTDGYTLPLKGDPVLNERYKAWKKQVNIFHQKVGGEKLKSHLQFAIPGLGSKKVAEMVKTQFPDPTIFYCCNFPHGYLHFITDTILQEEQETLLARFTRVFEMTYKRFLDLQKAEAQAREAQIEAVLERIRAEAMAMRESDELLDIMVKMRTEFTALGHEAHYFWHMKWEPEKYLKAMTSSDGTRIGMVMKLPRRIHSEIKQLREWEKGNEPTVIFVMDVDATLDYIHKMVEWGDFQQVDPNMPSEDDIRHIGGLTYVMARTMHGEIGYSLPGMVPHPPEEAIKTLRRFAEVFDMAYRRFEDLKTAEEQAMKIRKERDILQKTLGELQITQTQLIHAEKMASLGELTAGIAHEIQNPLNFVNNFSEVNKELIEELREELKNGNAEEIEALIHDLIENEEKVTQHGKRAEAIVKSMLQHSRGSEGQKELTDINALCDEYLRLAYHGFRAKDKSFNADFKLDLDPTLPKIEVVPQDFGRVLLNLINNAFQAVSEKSREFAPQPPNGGVQYHPQVTLVTRRVDTPLGAGGGGPAIQMHISDNGPGIPDDIRDKIFQPFFTTKPTGEGTGLGLSLSYDIVTKGHGGKLDLKSEEGKGTEFIISLPIV